MEEDKNYFVSPIYNNGAEIYLNIVDAQQRTQGLVIALIRCVNAKTDTVQ